MLYEQHIYYVDVKSYLRDENTVVPNWLNFVRHPIKRFESGFYYRRSDRRWGNVMYNLPEKVKSSGFEITGFVPCSIVKIN